MTTRGDRPCAVINYSFDEWWKVERVERKRKSENSACHQNATGNSQKLFTQLKVFSRNVCTSDLLFSLFLIYL